MFQEITDAQKTSRSLLDTYGLAWKASFFGIKELVFLHDPAMLQKLYMSWEPDHLHKPNWLYKGVLVGPLNDGVISSRGNVWRPHRTVLNKVYSYNSLKYQVKLFNEYGKKLINRLNEEPFYSQLNWSSDYHTGSFSRVINETAFDIISCILSGKEGILSEDEANIFHENIHRCRRLMSYRIYHPWLLPDMLWSVHPKGRELKKAMLLVDITVHKILKTGKEKSIKNQNKIWKGEDNGLMENTVVSLVDEMVKGGLSDEEMFAQIYTFVATGQEAPSSTSNLTLFYLAVNAEYQKNCQREVDQLFGEMMVTNQNEISMEAIGNLTFLDRCIKEALRLHPITPLIGRQLDSTTALDKNTTLKAGTTTVTFLWLLHRNQDYFPDPEKFDPDRFSPENCTNRRLCEYMPFAVGPRNCLGGKAGIFEVKVLMAYILYNYEISTEITVEFVRDAYENCLWPPPELPVRLTRRRC